MKRFELGKCLEKKIPLVSRKKIGGHGDRHEGSAHTQRPETPNCRETFLVLLPIFNIVRKEIWPLYITNQYAQFSYLII